MPGRSVKAFNDRFLQVEVLRNMLHEIHTPFRRVGAFGIAYAFEFVIGQGNRCFHDRVADGIYIARFFIYNKVMGIEVEAVRFGEVGEVEYTYQAACGDPPPQIGIEFFHGSPGIFREFFPPDPDTQQARYTVEDKPGIRAERNHRKPVQLVKGHIGEERA